MLSIHNNPSAGTQNVTGIIMLVAHVNNALTWQSSCVIANNTQKAICPRQSSHENIDHTMDVTNYISASQVLCGIISTV